MIRSLLALVAVSMLAVVGCSYSGVFEISGTVFLSDGVTPIASANADITARMVYGEDYDVENITTPDFLTGPDGGFVTSFVVDYANTDEISSAQLKINGSIGILIEDQLSAYPADVADLVRDRIYSGCDLTFSSRNYDVAITELKKGTQQITQDFVTDLTPGELLARRTCQVNALTSVVGAL